MQDLTPPGVRGDRAAIGFASPAEFAHFIKQGRD